MKPTNKVAHSDNRTPALNRLLVSALALVALSVCLAKSAVVSAAVISSGGADLTNELTNEKVPGNLFNTNQRQQQQRYPPPTIIANDLLEQPEAATSADQQQHQQQQQQLQQEPRLKLVSHGSAVINGNQATYVEPPADFKPIIYDHERQASDNNKLASSNANINYNADEQQASSSQHQAKHAHPMDVSIGPSGDSGNYLDSQEAQRKQQQQQLAQPYRGQQAAVGAALETQPSDTPLGADKMAGEIDGEASYSAPSFDGLLQSDANGHQHQHQRTNTNPRRGPTNLKPSIGRWSDWHDMSVEPDLASSDSLETASFYHYQLPDNVKSAVPPTAPFRIRNRAAGDNKSAANKNNNANSNSYYDIVPVRIPQQAAPVLGDLESAETTGSETAIYYAPMQALGQTQTDWRRQGSKFAHQPAKFMATKQHMLPINQMSVKLPQQQLIPQQLINAPVSSLPQQQTLEGVQQAPSKKLAANSPNNLIKIQQQQQNEDTNQRQRPQQQQQQQPSAQVNSWNQPQQQVDFSVKGAGLDSRYQLSGLQQQQPQQPKQNRNRNKKRRRKSKAKSKTNAEVRIQQLVAASQQEQSENSAPGKQVNGLGVAGAFLQPPANQASSLAPQGAGQVRQIAQVPPRQQNQQQQQQQLGERVPARQAPGSPTVIMRRFGAQQLQSSNSSASASTPAPASTAPPKKVKRLRRRRIKTQLPVGLSSWFLGGIRDLDGRHWQLPADVISRLAVNDVDLSHAADVQASKPEPPAAGSVVLLANEQTTQRPVQTNPLPPLEAAPARIPISQLIPR